MESRRVALKYSSVGRPRVDMTNPIVYDREPPKGSDSMTAATEGYADAKAAEVLATAELRFEQATNRLIRWVVGTMLTAIATAVVVTTAIVNGG